MRPATGPTPALALCRLRRVCGGNPTVPPTPGGARLPVPTSPPPGRAGTDNRARLPPPVRRCRRQYDHARQASSGRAKIEAGRAPRGHRTRSPLLPRSWAEVAPRSHRARGRPLASLASRTRPPPCDVRYARRQSPGERGKHTRSSQNVLRRTAASRMSGPPNFDAACAPLRCAPTTTKSVPPLPASRAGQAPRP